MGKIELLIIGGGPAAITIAKNIGTKKQTAIIRPEDHSMIYCAMPYAIEGMMELEKTLKSDSIVTDAGVELIRDYVTDIDFNKKIVTTEAGESYEYEDLVIASGADPILPPIEGSDLSGVMTFKTEEDLRSIIDKVKTETKEAVVVGAGAIGIELAQVLDEVGIKTHLVDMDSTILPNMMDSDMIEAVQKALDKTNITFHLGERVSSMRGETCVEKVLFESGREILFDTKPLVVFAVGMRPSVDFLKDSELAIGRTGIIVDDYMKTNIDHVYAVGDCCEFRSAVTGEIILGKLATNAVPMGRLLAKNLLGDNRKYSGFYNGAATKVMNYFVGSTGLSEKAAASKGYDYVAGKAKMKTAFPIMPFTKDIELKLIVDRTTQTVLGGQVVSGEPVTDKIDQITMAVQFGVHVRQLAQLSYSAQPYQSFFPANNLLAHASEMIINQLDKSKKTIRICCATDNGQAFTNNHFNDADHYHIYEISNGKVAFVKSISNVSAGGQKLSKSNEAKSAVSLIEREANVTLSNVYGPNLKHISGFVLPLITEKKNIEDGLKVIADSFEHISELSAKKGIYHHIDENVTYDA